mgnify:CR=1 FL=1|tara:strand:- start:124 stop:1287 length:1164 start_codon:yes stop_codon:yes gene_type:complete
MLNKILMGVLITAIIYNLFTIVINCKIINTHINKHVIENFGYECTKDQSGNGSDGYQCTIGCGGGREGRYPYKNMFDAEEGCIKRGFRGLCSKQEVIDGMKSYKHTGEGQCCAGYTSDIHQDGSWKGKSLIGYDRTSEAPEKSQKNPIRDSWCGGAGKNFKNWHPDAAAGAHCCGTARYDDLAIEYKKRSDVSASLLRVNNKISELNKERVQADKLNKQAETLTDIYDSLKDGHIQNMRKLCEDEKKLHEDDSSTQKGYRQQAIRKIFTEEKKNIDSAHKIDMLNEINSYKNKMEELENKLINSKNTRKRIVDLSKRSYIDARECSNNTDTLVVPSSISANLIPDSQDSSVFSPQPVTNTSEPTTDVQDNKSSLEEISISEPDYKNL